MSNKDIKGISQLNLYNNFQKIDPKAFMKAGLSKDDIAWIKKRISRNPKGFLFDFKELDKGNRLSNNYFVFQEEPDLAINKKDKNNNLLIEGDNYEALLALKSTGTRVDVIYIDPPYNTGKEFIYSDDYSTNPKPVGNDDVHKHSKWLSFMKKRLILAKELLTDKGVIFISIDDNEQAYLKVLMDEIFGEDNFMGCSLRKTKTNDKPEGNWVRNADYIVGYAKTSNVKIGKKENKKTKQKYEHEDERGKFLIKHTIDKKDYQNVLDFVVEIEGRQFYAGGSRDEYIRRQNGNTKTDDFRWVWNKESIEWGIKNNLLVTKGIEFIKNNMRILHMTLRQENSVQKRKTLH